MSSDRLVLLVLYVRASEDPLARRSRAHAAPILCFVDPVSEQLGGSAFACRWFLPSRCTGYQSELSSDFVIDNHGRNVRSKVLLCIPIYMNCIFPHTFLTLVIDKPRLIPLHSGRRLITSSAESI